MSGHLQVKAAFSAMHNRSCEILEGFVRRLKRYSSPDYAVETLSTDLQQRVRPIVFVGHSLGGLLIKQVRATAWSLAGTLTNFWLRLSFPGPDQIG